MLLKCSLDGFSESERSQVFYVWSIQNYRKLIPENDVLNSIYDYMSIWYPGVPFVVIPMIGNNIVRAIGDTFTPGMIMVAIALINVILDPLFTPLSVAFLTKILAGFGKEAVAAFGAATRVEMFAMMVIMALGSVMIIFTGQNLSKEKFKCIREALRIVLRFSLTWGTVVFILLLIFGLNIASAFTNMP